MSTFFILHSLNCLLLTANNFVLTLYLKLIGSRKRARNLLFFWKSYFYYPLIIVVFFSLTKFPLQLLFYIPLPQIDRWVSFCLLPLNFHRFHSCAFSPSNIPILSAGIFINCRRLLIRLQEKGCQVHLTVLMAGLLVGIHLLTLSSPL